MKYILLAAVAVIFIIVMICLSARKIAYELVVPNCEKKNIRTDFPHEKRFKIQSQNGYSISCLFVPTDDGMSMSEKIVVILHQFNSCKEDASIYSEIFTSMGYSVLIPDMRAHGESGGETSSMGFFEKNDVEAVIRWLKDCYGQDVFYGLFGLADGGATAILYANSDPDVKFVIADSAFSDLRAYYRWIFRNKYKIKAFPLLNFTTMYIKKIAGFSVKNISPIKVFKSKDEPLNLPLMLVHGDSDKKMPPQFSVDIYNAKDEGVKTLYLAPDCGHLEAFEKNREVYAEKIRTFIKNIIG